VGTRSRRVGRLLPHHSSSIYFSPVAAVQECAACQFDEEAPPSPASAAETVSSDAAAEEANAYDAYVAWLGRLSKRDMAAILTSLDTVLSNSRQSKLHVG
jgi:hypothetical protein